MLKKQLGVPFAKLRKYIGPTITFGAVHLFYM